MKFNITMKDPDGPFDCLQDVIESHIDNLRQTCPELSEDDLEDIYDNTRQDLEGFMKQWLEYGEYVTIEFDTENGTAILKKAK